MDKFNLEAFARVRDGIGVKTASELRELLADKDGNSDAFGARERLYNLFDAGTFSEIGAFVRRRNAEFDTDVSYEFESVICGFGAVDGRLVYAFSQDISRIGGSVSEAHARKICDLYKLAMQNGAPVVAFFESAGALIPEGVKALAGYGKIMSAVSAASGIIPQIAVVCSSVAGAASVICGMFDLVVKCDGAELSVNPKFNTVSDKSSDAGITAIRTSDVATAVANVKALLTYLPSNNTVGAPVDVSADNVNRLISADYSDNADVHSIITSFVDDGKVVELYGDYAPELVGCFASIGGSAVGIVANNKAHNGAKLTSKGVRKASRLVSLFDSFNIPIVTLVDSVGFDNSAESESSPFTAEIAKLAASYSAASSPIVTVVTGEAYGSLFTVMGSKSIGADVVYALEGAKIAAMNASSAVAFLFNDEITADKSRSDLESQWNEYVANPVEAAASGEIDDIISLSELRVRLGAALSMLSSKSTVLSSRRHLIMPL